MESPVYQFWKISVVMSCIVSSYIYAYFAAFGAPNKGTPEYGIDIAFEFVFSIDMIVCK